ncbi:hypothetical protein C8R43DRAFT_131508 [Mycena crocata]|nr:hypothetical protein C8R43DRAFT_131508 [Mycena crocata]
MSSMRRPSARHPRHHPLHSPPRVCCGMLAATAIFAARISPYLAPPELAAQDIRGRHPQALILRPTRSPEMRPPGTSFTFDSSTVSALSIGLPARHLPRRRLQARALVLRRRSLRVCRSTTLSPVETRALRIVLRFLHAHTRSRPHILRSYCAPHFQLSPLHPTASPLAVTVG